MNFTDTEQMEIEEETTLKSHIINEGFCLDMIFIENGWYVSKNSTNCVSYSKLGQETDVFTIKLHDKLITVSMPIKDSNYQFNTTFTDLSYACGYLENRFLDFI
jgi:hypothetical protein